MAPFNATHCAKRDDCGVGCLDLRGVPAFKRWPFFLHRPDSNATPPVTKPKM
jgi:hypothetical protein